MNLSASLPTILLSLASVTQSQAETEIPIYDAHSHYTREDEARFAPEEIVAILDRENVEKMVIIGTPAELSQRLYQHAPRRFIPFLGLYKDYRDKRDWMLDSTLPGRLRAELERGHYAGIGEIHLFAPLRRSPVFRKIVDMAAEYELPLLIHGDEEVIDQVFAWTPGATVLWAHLGTLPKPDLIRQMLARHPDRLYIDTSVRDERFIPEGKLLPQWRGLFIDHADRLLVGIDTFSVERWERITPAVSRIRSWLKQLPPEVAHKMAHGNARRLFTTPTSKMKAICNYSAGSSTDP